MFPASPAPVLGRPSPRFAIGRVPVPARLRFRSPSGCGSEFQRDRVPGFQHPRGCRVPARPRPWVPAPPRFPSSSATASPRFQHPAVPRFHTQRRFPNPTVRTDPSSLVRHPSAASVRVP